MCSRPRWWAKDRWPLPSPGVGRTHEVDAGPVAVVVDGLLDPVAVGVELGADVGERVPLGRVLSASVTTSSAHTSTYLGSPKSGISLMWMLKNVSGSPSMSSVEASRGGGRRWFRAVPPGEVERQAEAKLMPASTSRTPCRTFSGVSRLMRPSSSSSPQSPPTSSRPERCCHRFVTSSVVGPPWSCTDRLALLQHDPWSVTTKDFVVSAMGTCWSPRICSGPRLPKHLRDRGVWEEDFELDEPWVEGGARVFRRLHTPVSRAGRSPATARRAAAPPRASPTSSSRTWGVDGVDVQVMHPNLSLFGLYSDDHELSMARAGLQRLHRRAVQRALRPHLPDRAGADHRRRRRRGRDRARGRRRVPGRPPAGHPAAQLLHPRPRPRCGARSRPPASSRSSTADRWPCGWTASRPPSRSCSRTPRRSASR